VGVVVVRFRFVYVLACAVSIALSSIISARTASGQSSRDTSNRGCTFAGARNSSMRFGTEGGPYFAFTFDSVGSIIPDRRGSYAHRSYGVDSYLQNSGIRLYVFGAISTGASAEPTERSRRLRIDLSHPVTAGSPNLGIQDVSRWVIHWRHDTAQRVIYGLLDMSVGTESLSERMEIHVIISGTSYMLRLGNLNVSACWLEDAPNGEGTTPARIRRVSQDEWIVEIPPQSRGRLLKLAGQLPDVMSIHFEDRGLYEVSGRLSIRMQHFP
jgi:hypothetical protein